MEKKYDFLKFLEKNFFEIAPPNLDMYTHRIQKDNYFIGFKLIDENKYQFSGPKPELIITGSLPKNEKKAKEVLNLVLEGFHK